MERIRSGVLEVHTDSGPCYLRPSLSQRIRLLWTFRNFRLLPRQVLSQRELTLVEALLERGNCPRNDECCIGVIEWTESLLPAQSPTKQDGPATPITTGSNVRPRSRRRRGKKRSQAAPTSHAGISATCPARPR